MGDTQHDHTGLRTPIVAVLGHVDHGKTSLLDTVRGSAVIDGEAGSITQHIGSTEVPLDVVSDVAGELVEPDEFDLPGLLFIDTPGHQSFSTLRARGGALADIAILVVDVTDGFQPQTEEAIEILKNTQTPFIVAANKVDTIPGWNPTANSPIQSTYDDQGDSVRSRTDEALYELIGDLSDAGFSADFYWRVRNFEANIGVVPVSAETGEGVPDLLTVLMGLSQRYLREEMTVDVSGPGAGTVLELSDAQGFGSTIDAIIYDGVLSEGEEIVVGGLSEPIVTTVRALLKPRELAEIRTESRFEQVESVAAATGVKIAAPHLEDATAGAPVRVVGNRSRDDVIDAVQAELASVDVEAGDAGLVAKADTLGSLEALVDALDEAEIPYMRAEVGDVAHRDVSIASTIEGETERVILGFGVEALEDVAQAAADQDVTLITADVIYQLVEEYEEFVEAIDRRQREAVFENIVRPARIRVLPDHVFRESNPAVVGVEVLSGTLKRNAALATFEDSEPERIGQLSGLQEQGEEIEEARVGTRVSAAIDGPTVGRQIDEDDVLWVDLPEKHATVLEGELAEEIPADEREALSMFLDKRRKQDPFWGK